MQPIADYKERHLARQASNQAEWSQEEDRIQPEDQQQQQDEPEPMERDDADELSKGLDRLRVAKRSRESEEDTNESY